MEIADDRVVTISYSLQDVDSGDVLEEVAEEEGLPYLHGHDNIVAGLEEELAGMEPGDDYEVTVPPEKGFGERVDELVSKMDRDAFPEDQELEPGMVFQAVRSNAEGEEAAQTLMITEIQEDEVVVDANPPLAGKTLKFEGKVIDVEEASDEELAQGHPTRENPPE